jgi:hypothetical protein
MWITCWTQITKFTKASKYVWLDSLMVFNSTFNDISVISWRLVLLVEETGVPGKTTDEFYHIMLYRDIFTYTVITLLFDHRHYNPFTDLKRKEFQTFCIPNKYILRSSVLLMAGNFKTSSLHKKITTFKWKL